MAQWLLLLFTFVCLFVYPWTPSVVRHCSFSDPPDRLILTSLLASFMPFVIWNEPKILISSYRPMVMLTMLQFTSSKRMRHKKIDIHTDTDTNLIPYRCEQHIYLCVCIYESLRTEIRSKKYCNRPHYCCVECFSHYLAENVWTSTESERIKFFQSQYLIKVHGSDFNNRNPNGMKWAIIRTHSHAHRHSHWRYWTHTFARTHFCHPEHRKVDI